jgi:two-component system response regulator NreC
MPEIRTILLATVQSEDSFVLDAFRAGVRGYVVKTQPGADLVQAIRDVVHGQLYISPRLSRALVHAFLGKSTPGKTTLTERERRVLQLTAEGRTAREIAGMLGSSPRTVDSHRARIMCKLAVNGRSGLVRYAVRQGMIDP